MSEFNIADITYADIRERFLEGVRNVAALSLAIGYRPAVFAITNGTSQQADPFAPASAEGIQVEEESQKSDDASDDDSDDGFGLFD